MQQADSAKVEKVSKGVIKITFPPGTKAEILEEVPLQELLDALAGKSGLGSQSTFPLNAPVPI